MKHCLIIPVYNHEDAIVQVVEQIRPLKLHCILVNDGSSEICSQVLQDIAGREKPWVTLYEREENGGKGAAVVDGLNLAILGGFTHAIQIDADGQHKLADIPRFITASQDNPDKLILGQPYFDESVPKKRLYGRVLTNVWIWINTLSFAIADGMCGFRCYPLSAVEKLLEWVNMSQRMDFDIEIAVRLYWRGLDVVNIATEVQYPLDGVSHFKLLLDNVLISKMHAQLFFGMLCRFPWLLARHFK